MNHKLQCKCGSFTGLVGNAGSTMRVVCYCKDCQAYARHLGKSESVLDSAGGTDIVATQANNITVTSGKHHLACISLSEKGLLRWYTKCCNTPIANTPRDWRFPYAGLVHTCLNISHNSIQSSFPEVQMHVNTGNVKGAAHSSSWQKLKTLLGFIPAMLFAKLSGKYKNTPFFSASGTPVTEVTVLSSAELSRANNGA